MRGQQLVPPPCCDRYAPLTMGLYGLVAALSWAFALLVVNVQAQNQYCSNAEALARTYLTQNTGSNCASSVSSCAAQTTCPATGCVIGFDSATTTCSNGCRFTSGSYTVVRTFTGGYATSLVLGVVYPLFFSGVSHTFTSSSGVKGDFFYYFQARILDDSKTLVPLFQGTCAATLNGVDCVCKQFYCDSTETTYNNRIDCSAVPGGSVLNMCRGGVAPSANRTYSLLEALYVVPRAACAGIDILPIAAAPTAPVKAPVAAPVLAPTAPVTIAAPKSPPPVVVPSPSAADAPAPAPTAPSPVVASPMGAAPVVVPVAAPQMAPPPSPSGSGSTPSNPNDSTTGSTSKKCGLLQLSILCLRGCGLLRRLLGLCD